MSTCVCTPKQKDSGRYSKRCTAHHGHPSVVKPKLMKRKMALRCTDCHSYVPATHVPGNFFDKAPVAKGGWGGAAFCEAHARRHPGSFPDPELVK